MPKNWRDCHLSKVRCSIEADFHMKPQPCFSTSFTYIVLQCTLNLLIQQPTVLSMLLQSIPSRSSLLFALCDECRWCATYFTKDRLPSENRCPCCHNKNDLSLLSIVPNELFTFNDYKRGVELKFMDRGK